MGDASLSIFTLSPVSALSLTCTEALSISIPSAGIWSPASISSTSPTTTSSEGMIAASPFLRALALGDESFFSSDRLFSALRVWTVPSMAFMVITTRITTVLSISFINAEMTAAIISIITRKSLYCSRNITTGLFFFPSEMIFFPNFSAFSAACAEVSPFSPDPSSLKSSSGLRRY